MKYRIADLFCGAGGTSTGAMQAAAAMGLHPEVTAVNHWDVAIATHTANHPGSRHFCTGVDAINPRHLFKEGELDLLWASPECTHHSIARGGKPINDQSRATAWCVTRWAEALRPSIVLVENVPEFATWGPIGSNGRPLASKKGETFKAWLQTLRSLGYKVDYRLLCAADYGDPTTRTRLFVQAVRGRKRIVWPNPTHSRAPDLLTERRWTPAREIIDWGLQGESIYDRKRPLSPKTMARIEAGLRKFGLKDFIVPQFGERPGQDPRTHDLDDPAPAVTSHGAGALVRPFIVPQQSNPTPKSVDEPLPTLVAEGSGPKLVQPFLIPQHSSNGPRSIDAPAPTVTTTSRGVGLVEPYIVAWDHQSGTGVWSADAPLSAITTKARHGVAEPFLVKLRGSSAAHLAGSAGSLEQPVDTVTASGNHHGLVEPFLVQVAHGAGASEDSRVRALSEPLPTVCGNRGDMAIAQPYLVNLKGQSDAADIDLPSPTITAHAPHLYMAQPFLVKTANGESRAGEHTRARDLKDPLPTVTTSGDMALVEPCLLGQQQGAAMRPVSEPAPTVATAGAIALVEPFLVSFYGNGQAHDIELPAPTVTTKDRFVLVRPVVEINGTRYLLDIRFRMLQPHELSRAQGFPRDYHFSGNKTEIVKQVGNSVPVGLARAIVGAAISQNEDVSGMLGPGKEAA